MRAIFWDIDGVMNNELEARDAPIWSETLSNKDKIFDRMVSPSNFRPVMELLMYCFEKDIKMIISSSVCSVKSFFHVFSDFSEYCFHLHQAT